MNHSEFKLTWDQLRERSRIHAKLTETEKHDAVLAFTNLKHIFKDEFFDIKHPLFEFFIDRAGWRNAWAIWFATVLKSISSHSDFPHLVCDLHAALVLFEEKLLQPVRPQR